MRTKSSLLALTTLTLVFPSFAQAEEQLMILWPKQRAAHQIVMDDQAAAYKARGQAYVDHLYATGGEEQMPAPDDVSLTGDIRPIPINIGQVANIVKDTPAGSQILSPDTQTSAPPH